MTVELYCKVQECDARLNRRAGKDADSNSKAGLIKLLQTLNNKLQTRNKIYICEKFK